MQKVLRLSRSVTKFKSAQLGEKLNYRIKKFFLENKILGKSNANIEHSFPIDFFPTYSNYSSVSKLKFSLLNRSKEFRDDINWNFIGFGVLWNNILNSFDYLNCESVTMEDGLRILQSFIKKAKRGPGY